MVKQATPTPSVWSRAKGGLSRLAADRRFRRYYAPACVIVLFMTVLVWGFLGAKLQNSNADQLADPYLFTSWATFHAAHFPAAHTQLLKWPLFWLIALCGNTAGAFIVITLVLVLLTVAAVAYIVFRMERRPLVFGTLCLILAMVLLCVPPQPTASNLLPVNMAMLATRNIEYVAYIAALALVIRSRRTCSAITLAAVGVLGTLGASDKLFLSLSVIGAVAMLMAYAVIQNWFMVRLATRWLLVGIAAWLLAAALLAGIQASGLTHIAGASTTPYAANAGLRGLMLGSIYAVLGLLTNFGASPVYHSLALKDVPHQAVSVLLSAGSVAFLLAIVLFGAAWYAVWRVLWPTIHIKRSPSSPYSHSDQMVGLLVASTVASLLLFIGTNHYYAADARYLTISFFALVMAGVTYMRKQRIAQLPILIVAAVCCFGIASGLYTAVHYYNQSRITLQPTANNNDFIAQALQRHRVTTLVGDYWRVLPTKLASGNQLMVTPLQDCTMPRQVLASSQGQPDLHTHSFAYLFSMQRGLTDFPACTLTQVITAFGLPNASILVAGTPDKPTEQLLFYDHGIQKSAPTVHQADNAPATILPISLDDVVGANCDAPTVMNVVAHQDDDILFTSPDLLHSLQADDCVRTVYLTAGDAGNDRLYWLNRQQGSEAAYSAMLGVPNQLWIQRIVKLANNEFITIANPRGNKHVSLVFFNLPDGDLQGQGFASTHHQSLAQLYSGEISSLSSVDGQSEYTKIQLAGALANLMNSYGPSEIRTQADVWSSQYPDHSDHTTAGKITGLAANTYEQHKFENKVTIPLKKYIGYPIHGYPANITGTDLAEKEGAFLAYAQYDGGVCHSVAQCAKTPTYGAYISRQYLQDSAE